MNYEIGQIILGKVVNVKPYALFLEFEDGATGLLHISEISDSFIRDIEKYGSKGDEMKVMVVSIDESNGFLRVSYKRVPQEEAYSSHDNSVRNVPTTSSEDFKPLEEKLPEWIATTLAEAKGENK